MERKPFCVLSVVVFCFAALLFFGNESSAAPGKNVQQSWSEFFAMPIEPGELGYMCLGVYADIVIRLGDKTIIFDPSTLAKDDLAFLQNQKIDLIVYTHDHGDHFDKATAVKLFQHSAPDIVAELQVAKALRDVVPEDKLFPAESGQPITIGDMRIDPLKGKHIGPIMLFRVTVNENAVLHAGDSAYVPLETLKAAVAFVPTGYPSPTCSPKKAYKMVSDIEPQYAVALHGNEREHKKFAKIVGKKLPGTRVIAPDPYEPRKLTMR